MSYSHTQRRKASKRLRSDEEKSIAQKIRNGQMPSRFFVKDGDNKLERNKKGLTWATTFVELTKKDII